MIDREKLSAAPAGLWILGILAGISLGGVLGRSLRGSPDPAPSDLFAWSVDQDFSEEITLPNQPEAGPASHGHNSPAPSIHDATVGDPALWDHGRAPRTAFHTDGAASPNTPTSSVVVRTADAVASETNVLGPADASRYRQRNLAAPRAFGTPNDAAPIASAVQPAGQTNQAALDAILASELPNANEAELEVWRDVLAGLPVNDAREIVRMRKQLSHGPMIGPGLFPTTPKSPLAVPPTNISPFDTTLAVFDRAAQVIRHNIANADSVGFLPGRPVLTEAATGVGTDFAYEQILDQQWIAVEVSDTHCAVPEYGKFFAVESSDGERLLTVFGQFEIVDGTVGIAFTDGWLPVVPKLEVEDGDDLSQRLKETSLWQVDNPGRLVRAGAGRFRESESTGAAAPCEGTVSTGMLAAAAVDVAEQEEQLRLLEIRRGLLIHQTGRVVATP